MQAFDVVERTYELVLETVGPEVLFFWARLEHAAKDQLVGRSVCEGGTV